MLRGADNEEVTVTATRDTVEAQTVKYRMMDGQIGYVSVSEFDSVTYDQYQKALKDLEGQGMKGLVVDLRNNPGGNLNTVCDMLDLMLPKGLIVYTEDKDGNRQEASSDDENQFTLPLAVLVMVIAPALPKSMQGPFRTTESAILWEPRHTERAWYSRSLT